MKFIILILFSLFCISAYSQLTLSVEDLPKSGDVQLRARIDSLDDLLIEPGDAGENIDWEFSWMNLYGGTFYSATDSIMWIDKALTQYPDSFPEANIAQNSDCYFYHNTQTHVISLKCYNKYYLKDNYGLHLVGSSYPNVHYFQRSRNIFPILNYGDTLVEVSREYNQISNDSVVVRYILDTTIVDGWGVVHTPLDDINALRYHTTEKVWDSLYVNNIGELSNYQPDNYYYRWFTNGVGFPVFQISKGILEYQSQYKVTRFIKELKRLSVEQHKTERSELIVSPNPSDSEVKFFWKNKTDRFLWSLDIYDLNSRLVINFKDINSQELIISKGMLNTGFYFYKVNSKISGTIKGKIVILE